MRCLFTNRLPDVLGLFHVAPAFRRACARIEDTALKGGATKTLQPLKHQTAPVHAFFPRSNNLENSSCEAGATAASERFARTCSTRLIPTSPVVMPGVERTNCSARCASF